METLNALIANTFAHEAGLLLIALCLVAVIMFGNLIWTTFTK